MAPARRWRTRSPCTPAHPLSLWLPPAYPHTLQESPDPVNLVTSLRAIREIVGDPQLLVDLFVNYDCDLQASNLYERTVQVCGANGCIAHESLHGRLRASPPHLRLLARLRQS